jgi:hypothetical protein
MTMASMLEGKWECTISTPVGEQKSILTIAVDGVMLSGTSVSDRGTLDLEEGRVDGAQASWVLKVRAPFPMRLEACVAVDADTMTGSVKAGMMGSSPLKARRITG